MPYLYRPGMVLGLRWGMFVRGRWHHRCTVACRLDVLARFESITIIQGKKYSEKQKNFSQKNGEKILQKTEIITPKTQIKK